MARNANPDYNRIKSGSKVLAPKNGTRVPGTVVQMFGRQSFSFVLVRLDGRDEERLLCELEPCD